MIETITQNVNTSQLQMTYTQHSCTPTLTKHCDRNHQKSHNCAKLKFGNCTALYGHRLAPKLWHQHVVTLLDSLNFSPPLTDSSCFRHDELDIHIFVHVDEGMLCGWNIEIQRPVERLSIQVMMRIARRLAQLDAQLFFLGRVIARNSSWILG